ncbi:MAG: sodium/solute symporter [Gemmatimonadetes bacterium]|nr:sodium/solute symporter [Gemmatimonadota bacterium]
MEPTSFGVINWIVLGAFLLGTTLVGHRLRGDPSRMEGFFLGGRNIPWWAVAASLIATKTSALTFIAVPGFIFAAGGDLRYLQITLGMILGNILMAVLFIRAYYQEEIYSPYDYMENRLGTGVSQLARLLFFVGVVLSQAVRLLATALVLSVITGLSLPECILIMGVFAVAWCLMGGITTVIWTDFVQWAIYTLGAVVVVFWITGAVPDGVAGILRLADEQAKLRLLDLSVDPGATYTLWVGLVGMAVFELGQNAIDQVVTQRALCCANEREARKAVYAAAFGALTFYLMAFVGLGLVAFYTLNPPDPATAALLQRQPDRVFPLFLVERMPPGLSGLLIASIFAAGISTLDSALTALSQTTVAGLYQRYVRRGASERHYLRVSRGLIVAWAGVLCGLALAFHFYSTEGLLNLGLSVPGYVYGALLGIALLALWRRGTPAGIGIGVVASTGAVLALQAAGVAFFWWYPVACLVVIGCALALARGRPRPEPRGGGRAPEPVDRAVAR